MPPVGMTVPSGSESARVRLAADAEPLLERARSYVALLPASTVAGPVLARERIGTVSVVVAGAVRGNITTQKLEIRSTLAPAVPTLAVADAVRLFASSAARRA